MFALVRYFEDGILQLTAKKNLSKNKQHPLLARYSDGNFYPANVLCTGHRGKISAILKQLHGRCTVKLYDYSKLVPKSHLPLCGQLPSAVLFLDHDYACSTITGPLLSSASSTVATHGTSILLTNMDCCSKPLTDCRTGQVTNDLTFGLQEFNYSSGDMSQSLVLGQAVTVTTTSPVQLTDIGNSHAESSMKGNTSRFPISYSPPETITSPGDLSSPPDQLTDGFSRTASGFGANIDEFNNISAEYLNSASGAEDLIPTTSTPKLTGVGLDVAHYSPSRQPPLPASATRVSGMSRPRKRLFCYYCKQLQSNLSRHLVKLHREEPDVRLLLSFPAGSTERNTLFHKIRSMGSHVFNTNALHNDGTLIVTRRSSTKTADHYLPCTRCGAYYFKKTLYKHNQICPMLPTPTNIRDSRRAAHRYHPDANDTLIKYIYPSLSDDEVSRVLKYDKLLVLFGNALTLKYRETHLHYHIRQILRTVARLLITLKKINESITQFSDIFRPFNYNSVLRAVNDLARYNPETGKYDVPSVATRLGGYIRRCCDLFIVETIKSGDIEAKRCAKDFLKIFLTDFSSSIYKTATETQNYCKRNKVIELPQQSDVNKLSSFLLQQITHFYGLLSKQFSVDHWSKLLKYILCYTQLFNRKRAGEIERLLIKDFNSFQSLDKERSSVLYNSLNDTERHLANNFVKIDIRGKLGRTVPILIQKEHMEIIHFLLSRRHRAGVSDKNPYVFGSPTSDNSFFRACQAMKTCAFECGATEPDKLRGTTLRKHLATTAQVLNLEENEMGRLANFMGHDLAIHKQHYRLPSTAMELSETSKLLLIMEGADVERYRGRTLRDIDGHRTAANDAHNNTFTEPTPRHVDCPTTSTAAGDAHNNTVTEPTPPRVDRPTTSTAAGDAHNNTVTEPTPRRVDRPTTSLPALYTDSSDPDYTPANTHLSDDDASDDSYYSSKRKRPSTNSRRATIPRRRWTSPERQAVNEFFGTFFKDERLPSYNLCVEAKNTYPQLSTRSPNQIKAFVNNEINRLRRLRGITKRSRTLFQ